MLKKIINYTNFNDEEVTEEFFFHLSKIEIIEMENEFEGGMVKMIKTITDSGNGGLIIKTFKDFILKSYGVKSPDGRKFDKTIQIRDDFACSPAFDQLLTELMTDAGSAAQFVAGIMPKDLATAEEVKAAVMKAGLPDPTIGAAKIEVDSWNPDKQTPGWAAGTSTAPVPDPNGLDSDGAWPAGDPRDMLTGLDNPRDNRGEMLPWAFRTPTQKELRLMHPHQLQDAYRRKNSGWVPNS
jgi:hypothetical protein